MKIAIVGLDEIYVENFSTKLASVLNLKYINFKDEFEKVIIKTAFQSVIANDGFLKNQEKILLNKLINEDNVLISVEKDVFLSNKNYEILENIFTIYVETDEKNKILNNIQKLIKKHCKISIKQENLNINSIIDKIRGESNG